MPWKKCLAEMWMKDKPEQTSNTKVVKITKHNEPLGATVRNEGKKVVIGRVVREVQLKEVAIFNLEVSLW